MISLSVVSVITMVVGIGFVSLALYLPLTIVINNMDRQDKKAETPITNTEEAARAQPATKPERTQTTEPLKETSPMSTSEVRVNKEWGFAIVRSGADVEYVRWPSLTPLNSEQDDQIDLKNLPPMPGTRRTD